ncbi:uncharacterized protein LOC131878885 [Tigriopus californicus]|uniref:uncharacterized protein LOC131878885 n=1 Tax=Tigriopus californicus TaxID=6832 RepID=UPI0027DA1B2E|nr:uncharacterized protein LOC131878885 [Tigriopus californicus]
MHDSLSSHQSTQTFTPPSLSTPSTNPSPQPSTTTRLFDLFVQDFETQFSQLTDECKSHLKREKLAVTSRYVLDFLFCYLIICPLDVLFWRGTWEYSKIFLKELVFGDECVYTNITCLVASLVAAISLHFAEDSIRLAAGRSGTVWHKVVTRLFNIGCGIIEIYMFKGVWDGIDCYTEAQSILAAALILAVGVGVLFSCGALRSVISVPMGIVLDVDGNLCHLEPYFEHKDDDTLVHKTRNVIVSTALEICVIFVWHGVWTLIDIGFHHFHYTHGPSAPISFLVGFFGGFLILLWQIPLLQFFNSKDVPNWSKSLMNLFFCLFAVFFAVNSFRGTWYIIDEIYLTESYVQSLTNGWMIATALMLMLSTSASLQPGIIHDPPNLQDGVTIAFHYFTFFHVQDVEYQVELIGNEGIKMEKSPWRRAMAISIPPLSEKDFEKAEKSLTNYTNVTTPF